MPVPPITDLSARAREIFRVTVEGYLHSGQPIGSKALAESGAVNLSPASIRSVLAELEALGLLDHPHTSAGRVPTEQGLRLFVDGIMQVSELTAAERAAITREISQPGPIEAALAATTAVLSGLSACAGVVTVPRRDARLTQLRFVALAPRRVMAVLVSEDGAVENRVVDLPSEPSPGTLEAAGNYLSQRLAHRTLSEAAAAARVEIQDGRAALDAASADLVARGLAAWSKDATQRAVLIVRGAANLLDEAALADVERVRSLLDDLESKQSIAELLDLAREAQATRIFIGAENRLFALSGSSVIAAPYRDREGKVIGVVGVIGPTRLNYARLVPMVDFTARSLGQSLAKPPDPTIR